MLIFCFHHLEPVPRIKNRTPFTMTPPGLRNFIIALRLVGMKIVSMKEIVAASETSTPDNKRLCALTFDDGYESLYTHLMPVLREQNCPATVFALGGKFSGVNDWDPVDFEGQAPDPLLSLEQLREMGESGLVDIGSHGLVHRNMTRIDADETKREILDSYEILSQALPNCFVPVFAYPWGQPSEQALETLRQSKYAYAFTTEMATFTSETNRFTVPRYDIGYRYTNPVYMFLKLIQYRIGIFDFDFSRLLSGGQRQSKEELKLG